MNPRLPRYARLLFLCTLIPIISACATGRYTVPAESAEYPVRDDKALVVFMRASYVGGAITSALFDVSQEKEQLIAIVGPGEKLAHYVDPGKHQFMVVSEAADFMDAELEAGKIYYAIITPRMGMWRARFSLHPFKKVAAEPEFQLDSPELVQWLADCTYVSPNPTGDTWAAENADSIRQKRQEYLVKWNAKPANDKEWRTLRPQDGLPNPL